MLRRNSLSFASVVTNLSNFSKYLARNLKLEAIPYRGLGDEPSALVMAYCSCICCKSLVGYN